MMLAADNMYVTAVIVLALILLIGPLAVFAGADSRFDEVKRRRSRL